MFTFSAVNNAEQLHVARALVMPFIPMKGITGAPIRTKAQVRATINEVEDDRWLAQPELSGQRACLAVVDKKVFIQDGNGIWLSQAPRNARDFLKLPNGTCLDGKILDHNFHPFECLAIREQALIFRPVAERATVAFQLVKFLNHPWMFPKPSARFLSATKKNLPAFQGVTLKDYMSFYVIASREKKTQETAKTWLQHTWS